MRTKLLLLPLATLVALTLGATVAHADGNAPAGNNGTIKVDGIPFEDGNDNKPHPGCTFGIEFFGYDAGNRTAVLEFAAQSPTEGGALLEQTERFTIAERTGGNQLNHRVAIDLGPQLASRTPHPKQGYHVKLTVHVDGAQGADVKHKVFWVSECQAAGVFVAETAVAEPTTTVPPTTTTVDESDAAGAGGPGRVRSGVLSSGATAPGSEAGVSGELPRTGNPVLPLAVAALALLAVGGTIVAGTRRTEA